MQNYLNSDRIKVFPCGGRNSTYDPLARLTSEQNLISIINKLIDKDGFIISSHTVDWDMRTQSNEYLFNLKGYLFAISRGASSIIDSAIPIGSSESQTEADNKLTLEWGKNNKYLNAYIKIASYSNYLQMFPMTELKAGSSGGLIKVDPGNLDDWAMVNQDQNFRYKDEVYICYDTSLNGWYKCNENGIAIYDSHPSYASLLDTIDEQGNYYFRGVKFLIEDTPVQSNNANIGITLFKYKWDLKYKKDTNGIIYYNESDNKFSTEGSNGMNKYSLETHSGWVEYEGSKVKFETNGVSRSLSIDDGVI